MKKVVYQERVTVFSEDHTSWEVQTHEHSLETSQQVPKLGLMLVGWGGNNGSTLTAGILANRHKMSWETKEGIQHANYVGSFTQKGAIKVGYSRDGQGGLKDVYKTVRDLVPLVEPNDIEVTGWDISGHDLFQSCKRARVLEPGLVNQMKEQLQALKPMAGVYTPRYVASNQADRADNVFIGTNQEKIDKIRADIKAFKEKVDKVVVLWTANTEETVQDIPDIDSLRRGIAEDKQLQGSVLYAVAAIEEGVTYLNGSPQNTFHTGVVQLAQQMGTHLGGNDFKSGQTRFKTMMGDFLSGAGIKLASVVSYNHLGNNDGKNLAESHTFKSKETSKAGVLDDMVATHTALFPPGQDHIDHTVVIKYQPYVGDSKRAMDEYVSEIFMNGRNTITSYNVCEDSLLAVPLIIDMVLLAEYFSRVQVNNQPMPTVLSYLSFFFKAPITNHQNYVLNSFGRQKEVLASLLKATAGFIQEDNSMLHFQF